MTARWLVPSWSKTLRAHLCIALGDTGFVRPACGAQRRWKAYRVEGSGSRKRRPWVSLASDDGRPRCKRCEAMRKRAKEGGC